MSFLDSVLIFEISLIFQRFVTDFVNWFIMENHRQWYLRDILTDILWHFRLSIDLFMLFIDLQWFSLTHFHTGSLPSSSLQGYYSSTTDAHALMHGLFDNESICMQMWKFHCVRLPVAVGEITCARYSNVNLIHIHNSP